MSNDKPQIFLGLRENSNILRGYIQGFHALGYSMVSAINEDHPYYDSSPFDFVFSSEIEKKYPRLNNYLLRKFAQIPIGLKVFSDSIKKCDIFIFISGQSFFIPHFDTLRLLKEHGKKIVSVCVGTDIRYNYAFEQEANLLGFANEIGPRIEIGKTYDPKNYYDLKIRLVRHIEKYSDLILTQPDCAQLMVKPYMRLNLPIDVSTLKNYIPSRKVPIIVHAPSRRANKGTDQILKAIYELHSEGLEFEFQLLEKMSNYDVIKHLENADIVVDQLFSQTIATLALESMATGNFVLARYMADRVGIPPDCPAVNTNIITLKENLRQAIIDKECRIHKASQGRQYVEEHHSPVVVTQQILNWLRPDDKRVYDFTPTFFQNHFKISTEYLRVERQKLLMNYINKLTNL